MYKKGLALLIKLIREIMAGFKLSSRGLPLSWYIRGLMGYCSLTVSSILPWADWS